MDSTKQGLRERLKSETAEAHRRIETLLSVMGAGLTASRYESIVRGFYSFHYGFELRLRELADHGCQTSLYYLDARSKLEALARDIGAKTPVLERLRERAPSFPNLDREAKVAGALYVIEGSTLGGQVIAKHLASLPWTSAYGHEFFLSYGARTGAMWREFLNRLEHLPEVHADECVAGAKEAFDALCSHFENHFKED